VAAVSSNDVWAVGHESGGTSPALIEHWNGTSWSAVPTTSRDQLYGVAAISANNVWVVGYYSSSPPSLYHPESMHWDGSSWSQVSMRDRGALFNYVHAVAALPTNDVWAVGDNQYPEGTLIEHYTTIHC